MPEEGNPEFDVKCTEAIDDIEKLYKEYKIGNIGLSVDIIKLINESSRKLKKETEFLRVFQDKTRRIISRIIDIMSEKSGCWEKRFLRKLISEK